MLLIVVFSFYVSHSQQGLYLRGATLMNVNGDAIYVNGEVLNDTNYLSTVDSKILNTGKLYCTGNIQNNTNFPLFWNDSSGTVILNGTTLQQLIGDSLRFYALEINNPSGVLLQDSIVIQDTLLLTNGSLQLNGNLLSIFSNISNTGEIVGENNSNYIFGAGAIFTERSVNVGGNIAGMGLTLQSNVLGNTVLKRFHSNIPNAGDGSVLRYYTLSPNNIDTVPTTFSYLDHEINALVESDLDIFHSQDSIWWKRQFGTPNFATNSVAMPAIVYGNTTNFITVAEYYCDTPPAISFLADTMYRCGVDSVLLQTNLPNSLAFKWNNSVTDSAQYVTTQGTYVVEVWSPKGCYSKDSVVVIDKNKPYAAFSVPAMTCLGQPTAFQAIDSVGMEPIVNYAWHLDDITNTVINTVADSLVFQYASGGSFNGKLVVASQFGCLDSVMHTVNVDSVPTVSFSFADVCDGNAVTFTNSSSFNGLSSAISLNNWDFGDGNTNTTSSPTHTYALPGTYNVQLIVTENTGCKDTLNQSVTVHPNPVVSFTSNPVCERTATIFTNTSTGANVYQWDFESPNQSSAVNPSYTFSSDGVFNVQLIGFSAFGCSSNFAANVIVNPSPVAQFNWSDTCAQSITWFENLTTDTTVGVNYSWDFGDGNMSSVENPTHSFVTDGMYNVALNVVSGNGCTDSVEHIFQSFELPVADFAFSDVCEDSVVIFSNLSSIATGNITSYDWDFGNSITSSLSNPTTTYNGAAIYSIELITESNNGCMDTVQKNITIHPNPSINLGGAVSTCGSSLTLDAANSGSNYLWNTSENTQTITVTSDGTYSVEVTTAFGCHDEDTVTVNLNIVTHPNLGADTAVCDFVALDAFSPAATYSWSNGSTDSIIIATISGTYWVERIDQNGCLGFDTIALVVNNSPVVNLGSDQSVCEGTVVSIDAGNAGLDYAWSNGTISQIISTDTSGVFWVTVTDLSTTCFDEDTIQVTVNPLPVFTLGNDTIVCDVFTFALPGFASYLWQDGLTTASNTLQTSGLMWLEITDFVGCEFRDSINVIVEQTPIVNLGMDQTLCNGASLQLQSGLANQYLWSTGETTQNIVISNTGQYDLVANNGLCFAYDTIQVFSDSIWQIDIGADTSFCASSGLELIPNYNQGLSFIWKNPVNTISSSSSLILNQSATIVLEATNSFGCTSSDTILATAVNAPVSSEFLAPTNVLVGDTVHFISVTLDSNLTYSWAYGDNTFSTAQHGQHAYFITGPFDASLTVSNGICTDSSTKVINVGPKTIFNWDAPISGNDHQSLLDCALFPNPNNGIFQLAVLTSEEIELEVMILDLNGRILSRITRPSALETIIDFDTPRLSSGLYFVSVRSGLEQITKKFIKE